MLLSPKRRLSFLKQKLEMLRTRCYKCHKCHVRKIGGLWWTLSQLGLCQEMWLTTIVLSLFNFEIVWRVFCQQLAWFWFLFLSDVLGMLSNMFVTWEYMTSNGGKLHCYCASAFFCSHVGTPYARHVRREIPPGMLSASTKNLQTCFWNPPKYTKKKNLLGPHQCASER